MSEKPRHFGVGLKWALPTTVYFVIAVIAHCATYPRFVITPVSLATCAILGGVLVAAGLCVYAMAFVSLRRGLRRGILVTRGLYAIVHPLYASSILLIIPGVALASRSWLLLPMPAVAYLAFRVFMPAEEQKLHEQHGEDYTRYQERTHAIFPVPRRRGRRP